MPDIPAVHCEARKVSYRQTKEGLVVAFVIHPNDMPDTLATAPLGQRYMLALAAIGDDEQPIEPPSPPLAERPGVETGSSPTARARASELGKERYRHSTQSEQARARAAILAGDPRFQQYVASETAGPASEEHAAAYIRECCCDGQSRSLIAINPEFWRRFAEMDFAYRVRTGQMAEPR